MKKAKLLQKSAYGRNYEYFEDSKLAKAYMELTDRTTLDEDKKKALQEFGVEFE